MHTIFEAVVLVVIVVILFLQTWRAAIIPIVAIPVSLIGTFAVMAAFGFSLNNLSLFGLVLAIGIVVDDAIVVVENVERNLRAGALAQGGGAPDDGRGRRRADRHRAGALRACSSRPRLITGISGQFYRQFAVTIAAATADLLLRLADALSPALCALLLKPHEPSTAPSAALHARRSAASSAASTGCSTGCRRLRRLTARLIRPASWSLLVVYAGLIGSTGCAVPRARRPASSRRRTRAT